MNDPHVEVLNEVLEWSPQERGEFAAKLIDSLEPTTEDDIAASWVSEVRLRAAEIDSGEVTLLSWEEVRQSMRGEDGTLAD